MKNCPRKTIEKIISSYPQNKEEYNSFKKEIKKLQPKKLYKYLPFKNEEIEKNRNSVNYTLECLREKSLWSSIPTRLNDPFEGFNYIVPKNKTLSLNEIHFSFSNQIRKALYNEISITSFSEDYKNISMWSYYANNHKGICLEFDLSSLSFDSMYILPVYYSDKIITSTVEIKEEELLDGNKSYTFPIEDLTREFFLLRKDLQWEHEKEWRLILHHRSQIDSFKEKIIKEGGSYFKIMPSKILLGININKESGDFKEMIKLAKENSIDVYQMGLHYSSNDLNRYSLDFNKKALD